MTFHHLRSQTNGPVLFVYQKAGDLLRVLQDNVDHNEVSKETAGLC